ncbi:hypothetical protein CE91St45_05350 [Oscillospiraceae bacterium]|nr:hypothetical protein CE91St45_05350 [Oscillospiraceae bacterium]
MDAGAGPAAGGQDLRARLEQHAVDARVGHDLDLFAGKPSSASGAAGAAFCEGAAGAAAGEPFLTN